MCIAALTITIRYDTIEEFNVDSKKLNLNLAHVARKKYKKEETKTNKRQCPVVQYSFKIREGSVRVLRHDAITYSSIFVNRAGHVYVVLFKSWQMY